MSIAREYVGPTFDNTDAHAWHVLSHPACRRLKLWPPDFKDKFCRLKRNKNVWLQNLSSIVAPPMLCAPRLAGFVAFGFGDFLFGNVESWLRKIDNLACWFAQARRGDRVRIVDSTDPRFNHEGVVVKDAGDSRPFRIRFDAGLGADERDDLAEWQVARLALPTLIAACGRFVLQANAQSFFTLTAVTAY